MPRLVPFALAALLATSALAQAPQFSDPANLGGERVVPCTGRELPIDSGTLGLEQLLRKLQTRASILNIVAHPDDEDGGMLTLNARGLGARVADLSLTRGEGGQNAMTGDFEDALGLLRTQELLANDRYTGVTQMFGTEVDFGFSKTKSEAFAKWTHDRVLYDVVRAIRIYRPLVITATFVGAPTDGHGQHQVSGEIAQEAFVAAADPNVFPELTKEGILPWKPLKMYARVPRGAISSKGLYDYATNQYVPAEFTNYITRITTSTPPSTDIVIHEGTRDPLLTVAAANHADLPPTLAADDPATTLSYVQFARIGLGLQKSQIGPGVRTAPSGTFDVDYHLFGSRLCGSSVSLKDCRVPSLSKSSASAAEQLSFFDGIDTSLEGIADLAPADPALLKAPLQLIQQLLDDASAHYDNAHPEAIAPTLATALTSLRALSRNVWVSKLPADEKRSALHELAVKIVQTNDALVLSLGLTLHAQIESATQAAEPYHFPPALTSPDITIGSDAHIVSAIESGPVPIAIEPAYIEAPGIESNIDYLGIPLTPNSEHIFQDTIPIQAKPALITKPYFSRSSIEQPVYELSSRALRGAPQTPSPVRMRYLIEYNHTSIELWATVQAARQAVNIVPSISVRLTPHAQVLPSSEDHVYATLMIQPPSAKMKSISDGAPSNWQSSILSTAANCAGCNPLSFTPPLGPRTEATIQPKITDAKDQSFTEGYRAIGYGDLPRTNYFTPATDRIVPVDLKLPTNRRIAYLPGTGDAVPEALASIGLPVTTLTVADLTPAKLAQFDTVILGVRTYNAHPDLHGVPTEALLAFARGGGNVVVQYQTGEFTATDAPFPLSLGADEKVVDETTPVALLAASNALLTTPNQITAADFNGWIEERGHGFMETWDTHYTALTETHDPGSPSEHVAPQLPQHGGLLTVQVGKGRWTYVAFALYRQLPEAVPGAYRLMMNLLDAR